MAPHSRRPLAALAAAAAVALAAVAPAVRATEPAPPSFVVADAGNYILYDAEPGLAATLGPDVLLDRHSLPAFGFETYADIWRSVLGGDVVSHHPDAVVVLLGNADFDLARRAPDEYRRLLGEAVTLLHSTGAAILWLGVPPLPPGVDDEVGRTTVNALYAELPERFPGVVRYLSTDDVIGVGGRWVWTMPDEPSQPVRKVQPDGTPDEHVCPAGAVRLGVAVRDALERWLGPLPDAPADAEVGSWWWDPRYDDPPGACSTEPRLSSTVGAAASQGA